MNVLLPKRRIRRLSSTQINEDMIAILRNSESFTQHRNEQQLIIKMREKQL